MVDETGPPIVSFAGGMFSGRVESTMRESAQATYYNLLSVDAGPLGTGATITGSQTSQATGYQIQASNTLFSVTPAGGACVLPQTSRPFPFSGLLLYVAVTGANPITCFAHPSDPNNSINGQTANAGVLLGANTITPFQCFTPGIWFADSIGTGFAGSLETVVSQGIIAAAGSTQATATQITQAMVQVTTSGASQGVALPKATAGLQIVVQPPITATGTPLLVYPLNGSGDTINGGAANAALSITVPAATFTVFSSFTTGAWFTK